MQIFITTLTGKKTTLEVDDRYHAEIGPRREDGSFLVRVPAQNITEQVTALSIAAR